MPQKPEPPQGQSWREVYLAAVLENNKSRMLAKIPEAQHVIASRRSELLNSPASDTKEEIQALDHALFALHTLRNCLVIGASAA
jgi:hypothetical protein